MYYLVKDNKIINQVDTPTGSFMLDDGTSISNLEALTPDEWFTLGFLPEVINKPDFDSKEGVISGPVAEITASSVNQNYTFVPFTDEEKANIVVAKQEDIKNRALLLETQSITGSGIGLVTIGILQGKPKATAVEAWIKSIWTLAFSLIPQVTYRTNFISRDATGADVIPGKDQLVVDFSVLGPIPYSVQELMAEMYA